MVVSDLRVEGFLLGSNGVLVDFNAGQQSRGLFGVVRLVRAEDRVSMGTKAKLADWAGSSMLISVGPMAKFLLPPIVNLASQ